MQQYGSRSKFSGYASPLTVPDSGRFRADPVNSHYRPNSRLEFRRNSRLNNDDFTSKTKNNCNYNHNASASNATNLDTKLNKYSKLIDDSQRGLQKSSDSSASHGSKRSSSHYQAYKSKMDQEDYLKFGNSTDKWRSGTVLKNPAISALAAKYLTQQDSPLRENSTSRCATPTLSNNSYSSAARTKFADAVRNAATDSSPFVRISRSQSRESVLSNNSHSYSTPGFGYTVTKARQSPVSDFIRNTLGRSRQNSPTYPRLGALSPKSASYLIDLSKEYEKIKSKYGHSATSESVGQSDELKSILSSHNIMYKRSHASKHQSDGLKREDIFRSSLASKHQNDGFNRDLVNSAIGSDPSSSAPTTTGRSTAKSPWAKHYSHLSTKWAENTGSTVHTSKDQYSYRPSILTNQTMARLKEPDFAKYRSAKRPEDSIFSVDRSENDYDEGMSSDGMCLSRIGNASRNNRKKRSGSNKRSVSCYGRKRDNRRDVIIRSRDGTSTGDEDSESASSIAGSMESRMKNRRRRLRKSKTLLQVSKEDGWTNRMAIQATKVIQNYKDRRINSNVEHSIQLSPLKLDENCESSCQKFLISPKHDIRKNADNTDQSVDLPKSAKRPLPLVSTSDSKSVDSADNYQRKLNGFDYMKYQREIAPMIRSLKAHDNPALALLAIDKDVLNPKEDEISATLTTQNKLSNNVFDSIGNLDENSKSKSPEMSKKDHIFGHAETDANFKLNCGRIEAISALICLCDNHVEKIVKNAREVQKANPAKGTKLKKYIPIAKPRKSLENPKINDRKSTKSKTNSIKSDISTNQNNRSDSKVDSPLISELLLAKNELASLRGNPKNMGRIYETVPKRANVADSSPKVSELAKSVGNSVVKKSKTNQCSGSKTAGKSIEPVIKSLKIVSNDNDNNAVNGLAKNNNKSLVVVPPKIATQRRSNNKSSDKNDEKSTKRAEGDDKLKNALRATKITRNESTSAATAAAESTKFGRNDKPEKQLQRDAVSSNVKKSGQTKIKSDKIAAATNEKAKLNSNKNQQRDSKTQRQNATVAVRSEVPKINGPTKRDNNEMPILSVEIMDRQATNLVNNAEENSGKIDKIRIFDDVQKLLRLGIDSCLGDRNGRDSDIVIANSKVGNAKINYSPVNDQPSAESTDEVKFMEKCQIKMLTRSQSVEQKAPNKLEAQVSACRSNSFGKNSSTFSLHSLPSVDREMLQLLTLGEELNQSQNNRQMEPFAEKSLKNEKSAIIAPSSRYLNPLKGFADLTDTSSAVEKSDNRYCDSDAYSLAAASNQSFDGSKEGYHSSSMESSYKKIVRKLHEEKTFDKIIMYQPKSGKSLAFQPKERNTSEPIFPRMENELNNKAIENSISNNSTMESSYKKAVRMMNDLPNCAGIPGNKCLGDKTSHIAASESLLHRPRNSLEQATSKIDQMLRLARNKHKQEKMQLRLATDELEEVYEQMSQQLTKNLQNGARKSSFSEEKSEQKFTPVAERVKKINKISDNPKALELNFEKLRSHSFNSTDDLQLRSQEIGQGVGCTGRANRLDYTKKWLEGDLKSLINDPKPDLLQFGSQIRMEADQGSIGSASAEVAAITNKERLHALKIPDLVPHKLHVVKPAPLNLPAILVVPSTSFDSKFQEQQGKMQLKFYKNEFVSFENNHLSHRYQPVPIFTKALSESNDRDRAFLMKAQDPILNIAVKDSGLVKKQVDLFDKMSDNESERSYTSDQLCYKKFLAHSSNSERIVLNSKVAGVIKKLESEELLPSHKWASIEKEQAKLEKCVRGIKSVCKLQARTVSLSRNGSTHSLPVIQAAVHSTLYGGARLVGNFENTDLPICSTNLKSNTIQNDSAANIELLTPRVADNPTFSVENILADLNLEQNRQKAEYVNNRTRFPSEIRRISPNHQCLNAIPEYAEHYENINYANKDTQESYQRSLLRNEIDNNSDGLLGDHVSDLSSNHNHQFDSHLAPPQLPPRSRILRPPETFTIAQRISRPYNSNRNSWHEPPFHTRLQIDPLDTESVDLYESIMHLNKTANEKTLEVTETEASELCPNHACLADNTVGKNRMRNLLQIFKSNKYPRNKIYNNIPIKSNASSCTSTALTKPRSIHKSLSENHTSNIPYREASNIGQHATSSNGAIALTFHGDHDKPKKSTFATWGFLKR